MSLTAKDVRELYARTGMQAPPDIAAPSTEHIRNTRRKELCGIQFRSTLEASAWQVLSAWEKVGAISELKLQPRFVLQEKFIRDGYTIRQMVYTADFQFIRDGQTVVVEAKGHKTEGYMMRRKMFLKKYPELQFEEWTKETLKGL